MNAGSNNLAYLLVGRHRVLSQSNNKYLDSQGEAVSVIPHHWLRMAMRSHMVSFYIFGLSASAAEAYVFMLVRSSVRLSVRDRTSGKSRTRF